jgi:hypothetical protein
MAQRTQLVCQHLENISWEALEKYQDIIPEYVDYQDSWSRLILPHLRDVTKWKPGFAVFRVMKLKIHEE